jgi:DNA-binding CsgD family transcriptional regulator/PAS domain-containing protein
MVGVFMPKPIIESLLQSLYAMPQVTPDWSQFLATIGEAFHAHVVAFHTHDVMHQSGVIDASIGLHQGFAQKFKELAHEHPWYLHGGDKLFRDGIADDEGLLPEREFRSSRFYCELLKPAYVDHGMALVLHHDGPANMALLSINRTHNEGHYHDSERKLARTLLPHLRTAYLLQQRLGWMETQARTFRCALDRLEDGVILLDGCNKVRFVNSRAEQFAAAGMFACQPDGSLRLPSLAQSRALAAFLATATLQAHPLTMQLTDRLGHALGTFKACPVQRVASQHWGESDAVTMLFFTPVQPEITRDRSEQWRQRWKLTPAETTLARHLAEGLSMAEAAETGGVSRNTVRTQLRALMAKIGTHRQSELVRALLLDRL